MVDPFITFLSRDNTPLYINLNQIVAVYPCVADNHNLTTVDTTSGQFDVKGSLHATMNKIREVYEETEEGQR